MVFCNENQKKKNNTTKSVFFSNQIWKFECILWISACQSVCVVIWRDNTSEIDFYSISKQTKFNIIFFFLSFLFPKTTFDLNAIPNAQCRIHLKLSQIAYVSLTNPCAGQCVCWTNKMLKFKTSSSLRSTMNFHTIKIKRIATLQLIAQMLYSIHIKRCHNQLA